MLCFLSTPPFNTVPQQTPITLHKLHHQACSSPYPQWLLAIQQTNARLKEARTPARLSVAGNDTIGSSSIGAILTPASYDYDSLITVLVGAGEERFTVHKDVICVKSKFFRAACSDRWQEGQEKVVRLPEARSIQGLPDVHGLDIHK